MSPDSEIISFPDEEIQFQIVHIQFGFADEKKKKDHILNLISSEEALMVGLTIPEITGVVAS